MSFDKIKHHVGYALSLPKGWEIKKLGEVIDIINGRNQSQVISEKGEYPIYGSAGNLMGYATDYLCERGTTIIGRKGNITNPIFIEERFWNVDTAFGLYPKNESDPKFINYLCQTIDFKSRNRGTTIPSLVKSDLLTIDVPFVSALPEQQRIVSILNECFSVIERSRNNAEQNLKNAKELFESYLQGVFANRNWETKTLNQISENLDSKRIPITKNQRKIGEIPYYGASGIVDYVTNYIFNEDLLCVSEDGANLLARTYPIAFTISGKTWVNNHAHVLRFTSIITQKFVEVYINSIKINNYVSGMAQPKLNQAMLNKIPIPLPPLKEQQTIVRQLDALRSETQKLEALYKKKIADLEELKKSILQKAFSGELKTEKAVMI